MNTVEFEIKGRKIVILRGDITKQKVDVIVNAANSALAHGGGVARAIALAAGEELIRESNAVKHVPTGKVAATTAGNLDAKLVIHAVGPVWHGGNRGEAELLASCVTETLELANEKKMHSVAFPAISTGIFGYPLQEACDILLENAYLYLAQDQGTVNEVRFVLFDPDSYYTFEKKLKQMREN